MKTKCFSHGSIYTTHFIEVLGSTFEVQVVTGNLNYVFVTQKYKAGPIISVGIYFNNFDKASMYYQSLDMKIELLKIELGLN